jgi:acetyl-CoA acyltransferase 1
VLLMKRSKALELGQPIVAKFVGATVAGLAPRIMGIGPSIAVPKLLTKYNLDINDIDLIELNEAFASMAVYCKDVLKIDHSKLNVRGGAIALVSLAILDVFRTLTFRLTLSRDTLLAAQVLDRS